MASITICDVCKDRIPVMVNPSELRLDGNRYDLCGDCANALRTFLKLRGMAAEHGDKEKQNETGGRL